MSLKLNTRISMRLVKCVYSTDIHTHTCTHPAVLLRRFSRNIQQFHTEINTNPLTVATQHVNE